MIVARSSSDVVRKAHPAAPDGGLWITDYIGRSAGTVTTEPEPPLNMLFPCAFLIEQDPGMSGGAHFHQAAEFQVVVSGDGTFGKHEVGAVSVHYAGAYTPYGPLTAGPHGLGYMTLRDTWDSGAKMLPKHRELLRSGNRKPRATITDPRPPAPVDALRVLAAPATETLIAADDGLAAWLYRIQPAAAWRTGIAGGVNSDCGGLVAARLGAGGSRRARARSCPR